MINRGVGGQRPAGRPAMGGGWMGMGGPPAGKTRNLGKTLRQLVRRLVEWSGAHLTEVDAARAEYDARNGRPSKAKSTPLADPASAFRPQRARAVVVV